MLLLLYTLFRYYEVVRDVRQNKGSILKASVDYIGKLKVDLQKKKVLEEKISRVEAENKRLLLRLQVRNDKNIHGQFSWEEKRMKAFLFFSLKGRKKRSESFVLAHSF